MEIPRRKTIQRVTPEVTDLLVPFPTWFLCCFAESDVAEDDAARSHSWQNGSWIYPKAMNFLEIPEYRPAVLAGLLMSIGSKTDSTVNTSRIHRLRVPPEY